MKETTRIILESLGDKPNSVMQRLIAADALHKEGRTVEEGLLRTVCMGIMVRGNLVWMLPSCLENVADWQWTRKPRTTALEWLCWMKAVLVKCFREWCGKGALKSFMKLAHEWSQLHNRLKALEHKPLTGASSFEFAGLMNVAIECLCNLHNLMPMGLDLSTLLPV